MRRFTCMGLTAKGKKCKNVFLTSKHSEELTCSIHKDQIVEFEYSTVKTSCILHDIAHIIASNISNPQTFLAFAQICLSAAKACHKLQDIKKKEFSTPYILNGNPIDKYYNLPNGNLLKL